MGIVKDSLMLETKEQVKSIIGSRDYELIFNKIIYMTVFNKRRLEVSFFRSLLDGGLIYDGTNSVLDFSRNSSLLNEVLSEDLSTNSLKMLKIIFKQGSFLNYVPKDRMQDLFKFVLLVGKDSGGKIKVSKLISLCYDVLNKGIKLDFTDDMVNEFFIGFSEAELDIFLRKDCDKEITKSIAQNYNVSSSRISQIYNSISAKGFRRFVELREVNQSWQNILK